MKENKRRHNPIQVLLIEDNPIYVQLIQELLDAVRTNEFRLEEADRLASGLTRLTAGGIDVVLLDLSLPDSHGLKTFLKVHQKFPQAPVVVLTDTNNETLAAKTVYAGAQDYLIKADMNPSLLARVILHAIERNRMLTELIGQHTRRWQSSESRFQTVIENMADGLLVVDKIGLVRFANPAAGDMFAHKTTDLVGELFGFPIVSGETTGLDLIQDNGRVATIEMRVTETEWGGDQLYLASLRDVTERVQVEERLQASLQEKEVLLRDTQLQHKSAQLAAVREISRAIAEAQDLDSTLDLITRRTTEVMHADSCSIYLYNPSNDKLVLAASTGLNQVGIGEMYLPHGAGLTGWAAEHRQVVAVTNAFEDSRFYRIIGSGESRFPSLMAMPLVSRNKVIGAANVQTVTPHEFTEDEVELFGFIAELAAVALEKAQLVHTALVQEMHHRVKNNLQTIAMLLRLQMDEDKNLSPHDVLNETINRVLSIAAVHEILSEAGVDQVGALDLIKRMTTAISSNMLDPTAEINISVEGDNIALLSQRATSLALVANELIQNALEHGMANRHRGRIDITLTRENSRLRLRVIDNGRGLPSGFDPETDLGLGLEIVKTSVLEDMAGSFEIGPAADGSGTRVEIILPIDSGDRSEVLDRP